MTTQAGVSFIVPVRNGAGLVRRTLEAILRETRSSKALAVGIAAWEILVVDDGSIDHSIQSIADLVDGDVVRVVPNGAVDSGAAAAINVGIRAARYRFIAQIDQDVYLRRGWLVSLIKVLVDDSTLGAVQGYYDTDQRSICARVMNLDLRQRYAAIEGDTDHVCTGNTIYRLDALEQVGLFDESLGYGYDNDLSYRLRTAGYRLQICPEATGVHQWREGLGGYLRQQYGFGYGRLDLVAKHPSRFTGDAVSPITMMLHPVTMGMLLLLLMRGDWGPGLGLVAILAIERFIAGARAAAWYKDRAAWLFPIFHLARDVAWTAAIGMWLLRRLTGQAPSPSFSMQPRAPSVLRVPD